MPIQKFMETLSKIPEQRLESAASSEYDLPSIGVAIYETERMNVTLNSQLRVSAQNQVISPRASIDFTRKLNDSEIFTKRKIKSEDYEKTMAAMTA